MVDWILDALLVLANVEQSKYRTITGEKIFYVSVSVTRQGVKYKQMHFFRNGYALTGSFIISKTRQVTT